MNFFELECFTITAKYENMTKAANELHISQPALSHIISQLEKQVGGRLFDRNGKKIKLSHDGATFLMYTKNILSLKNRAIQAINAGNKKIFCIRFAAISNLMVQNLLVEISKNFEKNKVSIVNQILSSEMIEDHLLSGNIDVAITSPPIKNANIQNIILQEDTIYLYLSRNHSLSNNKQISLTQIQTEKIAIVSEGYQFHQFVDDMIRASNIKINYAFEGEHNVVVELIQNHGFLGFISDSAISTLTKEQHDRLCFIEVKEFTMSRIISLSYKKVPPMLQIHKELIEFIKNHFHNSISYSF